MTESVTGRHRGWVFTINNYTPEELELCKEWPAQYLIFGEEVGECGTPHLQGFVYFTQPQTWKAVNKLGRMWTEPARAKDVQKTINYCKKDGKFFERGEQPRQGNRTDCQQAHDMAKNLKRPREVYEAELGFQAQKLYESQLPAYYVRSKRDPVRVEWMWGPPGTGKTYNAVNRGGVILTFDGIYCSPYFGDEHVVLDDIRPSTMPSGKLLQLLDQYPFMLNVKGKHVPAQWTTITVTTCLSPEQFWDHYTNADKGLVGQLLRRLTLVQHCTEVFCTEVGGNIDPDLCATDRTGPVLPEP